MNFQISVGDAIPTIQQREMFKFVLEFEHGDADAHTTDTLYVKYGEDKLLNAVISTLDFMASDLYPPCYEKQKQIDVLNKFLSQYEEVKALIKDYVQVIDCTDMSHDTFANLTGYHMTYFDSKCVERFVEVTKGE